MANITCNNTQKDAIQNLIKDMESTAKNMRSLIIKMPPKDLIGYIYSQIMMHSEDASVINEIMNDSQFLLEYVHAVLASDVSSKETIFDESDYSELFKLSSELKKQALFYAMASTTDTENQQFGSFTAELEYHTKSSWVLLRGNRYQVLEGEFYHYVLSPHNDILKEIYGIGASEVAKGFQDMTSATRSGQTNAIEEMLKQFESAERYAEEQGKPLEDVLESWIEANPENSKSAGLARDDMIQGGITNVSRHTNLPNLLLADLSYQRGEEKDFFANGNFVGTPYRTLPVRKKPLIKIESDYYAVDPCFARDSGYRALLFNLLQHKPKYKKTFIDRQKIMSEDAFSDILADQFPKATIYNEVYYKDPKTKQWAENDTLILIEDMLYLIEAKAGAQATIASPALDLNRHIQSVQDLVIKAYKQCERFFNYLVSSDEVSLYYLKDGKYEECARISHSNYRVMLPIGLTVESFTPFSSYCKELPQITPLLGKHAFFSLSIDDLFVMKRILPTPGIFAHYMEVRQTIAGIRRAYLFDEIDHLGAYITKNRFDQDMADQLKDENVNIVIWDGMSNIINRAFEGENWEAKPMPTQEFPDEVSKLLSALNKTRSSGWLSIESIIRNYDDQARNDLAKNLAVLNKTICQYGFRYFMYVGEELPVFIWLQITEMAVDWNKIHHKAMATALCIDCTDLVGILVTLNMEGDYNNAQIFKIRPPSNRNKQNQHIFDDAEHMNNRMINLNKTPK